MATLPRVKIFDPFVPSVVFRDGAHRANPALFRCACGGTMFDVTSKLAEAMGVLHHQCDSCGKRTVSLPRKK